MTLLAELRHNNHILDVKTGTRTALDHRCRDWCNKRGKAATISRVIAKPRSVVVLAEYRHDGTKLLVEIVQE